MLWTASPNTTNELFRPRVRSSGQGAIMCKSCVTHQALSHATCCVPRGMKGQLSYQILQSLNCIYFCFILLAEPLPGEGGEEYLVKTR